MKVSIKDNQCKTGFQQPMTGLPIKQILSSLILTCMHMDRCLNRELCA